MATYKEIQHYIKSNFGISVETCHIADVKKRCGLEVRVAPNRKSADRLVRPCPDKYVQLIRNALENFNII